MSDYKKCDICGLDNEFKKDAVVATQFTVGKEMDSSGNGYNDIVENLGDCCMWCGYEILMRVANSLTSDEKYKVNKLFVIHHKAYAKNRKKK